MRYRGSSRDARNGRQWDEKKCQNDASRLEKMDFFWADRNNKKIEKRKGKGKKKLESKNDEAKKAGDP